MKNIIEKIKSILYDKSKKRSIPFPIEVKSTEKYVTSPFYDSNGTLIKEGDIIIADGYGTIPDNYLNGNIHCVEYCEGKFGSDIYGDFDSIEDYNHIKVVGHCEELRQAYEQGRVHGNIGTVLKT